MRRVLALERHQIPSSARAEMRPSRPRKDTFSTMRHGAPPLGSSTRTIVSATSIGSITSRISRARLAVSRSPLPSASRSAGAAAAPRSMISCCARRACANPHPPVLDELPDVAVGRAGRWRSRDRHAGAEQGCGCEGPEKRRSRREKAAGSGEPPYSCARSRGLESTASHLPNVDRRVPRAGRRAGEAIVIVACSGKPWPGPRASRGRAVKGARTVSDTHVGVLVPMAITTRDPTLLPESTRAARRRMGDHQCAPLEDAARAALAEVLRDDPARSARS